MADAAAKWIITLLLALAAVPGHGEQRQSFGGWDVHYVVLATGFLKPAIAQSYGITRGRDRALVNVSVLDPTGAARSVAIQGTVKNLLGQLQPLEFREVKEGEAVYYLATVRHTHEEVLRFDISISAPGAPPMQLKFQQKLYWQEP
ncbi:MAG: DUF4426 domain-containing protein [Pseudomonadales bacterium]|nr:DUF4426 domain-containing protein [Pseudomonadales bacterium]NIX07603.1 DUF4426 domain-containing protein [Pseudomonadales bacterium]